MTLDRMGRKPFQEATVLHAVARLRDTTGPRRFLVADEVGLGKTLVAQGILQHLAAERPLNVFYVCSSLTIAKQNQESLLEVLPEAERRRACVEVDRPTLLPWTDPSHTTGITLFTLTPGTLPLRGSSRGRVDERAAIWCLLREGLPSGGTAMTTVEERLRLVQASTWEHEVARRSESAMLKRVRDLSSPFVSEVRARLRLSGAGDRTVADALGRCLKDDVFGTVQWLRQRLARLGFGRLRPDLVILDEFQRFFEVLESQPNDESKGDQGQRDDVVDDDEDAHGLLRLLLGTSDDSSPAILLLSATPYRPPVGSGNGASHYDQFFKLLEFLHKGRSSEVLPLKDLFRRYGTLLREASPGTEEVRRVRDEIQERLYSVIARTERAGLLENVTRMEEPSRRAVKLAPADVQIYRHLWASSAEEDRGAVTPYWSSIPYPLQMTDQRYVLRKRAQPIPLRSPSTSSLLLRTKQVHGYEDFDPPHPRMRALLDEMSSPIMGLPWLPPTLPWWPLEGQFAKARGSWASKVLLFSRFRAVPRAVASLLSYDAERRVFGKAGSQGRSYDYQARRRDEPPSQGREALPSASFQWRALEHSVLTLFVPAPRLGELGDPQSLEGFSSGTLRRSDALHMVERRVADQMTALGIQVRPGARSGEAWRALLRLESGVATWPALRDALAAWAAGADNQNAKAVVQNWLREVQERALIRETLRITEGDVEELAELALVGPGVVLHRAARRVFGDTTDPVVRNTACVRIALGALRTYLDEPEFHLTLGSRDRAPNHPESVRRAIWHGNFEAVLDEYFAVHAGLGATQVIPSRQRKALEAVEQALAIRVSTVTVQSLDEDGPLRLRCHAAMPFGLTVDKDATDSDGATRPDALRLAFNSPFRPFVLATTSIGQEGLDFHVYCDRLIHWDLPASPVDLEQRDGRIDRYGGLAIRKVLALPYLERSKPLPSTGSPWVELSAACEETCYGMAPWWGVPGAVIHRTVFLPPLARQGGELTRLLAGLSHYRLALGQSDPEQLLRALHRKLATSSKEDRDELLAWLREVRIDLAPISRQRRR